MADNTLKRAADNIRILSAAMVEKAKSGHPGGAMGGADFMAVLFGEFLRFDPNDMGWPMRDRFFLDPGHMSPMLYSTLHLVGGYSMDDLQQFRQWASVTPGHPERDIERGVENTSGPLGLGHAMALGAAITERFLVARFGEWMAHKTYVYISDGGIQEEIAQGVGRIAGHLGLANLVMFYDSNGIQLSHETSEVTSEDTARKYEAWGWRVESIDGNDIGAIRGALQLAVAEKDRPTLIIGSTVMGKGAVTESGESFENEVSTHGQPLSKAGASLEKTVANLGGDPRNPFALFPDVAEHFKQVMQRRHEEALQARQEQAAWEKANVKDAARLRSWLAGDVPEIDYEAIVQKPGAATRAASGAVLSVYAQQVENMIVCSADLSNSDNTDKFLAHTNPFRKGDFSGQFLQVGVSELTMAAIANGMALHGGVIPACATFFVFSDYMKPALRLACLMGLPVKYIWTHDAFRVGEDGPTHQPVEHEAQARLLEKLNNLEGRRSMLVLRPADAVETTVSWKLAMEHIHGPSALLLSRQGIPDIPALPGSTRYADALHGAKGAYVVRPVDGDPDLICVANGSEVAVMVAAADLLSADHGLNVSVVSALSEGLFREQDEEYQNSVLPYGAPILGLTAGSAAALQGLMGPLGRAVGLPRFGASAPYTVLDEKFGYTAERVVALAREYLEEYRSNLSRLAALAP